MAFSKSCCLALLFITAATSATAVQAEATDCRGDETCSTAEMPTTVKASAMIQVKTKKHGAPESMEGCAPKKMDSTHLAESRACVSAELQESHLQALRYYAATLAAGTANASSASGWDGYTAPGTAEGFFAVTSLCCPEQTYQFFLRLLDMKGLKPCYPHETLGTHPHIQGLIHWFTCVAWMDFQVVLNIIDNGSPCKYWAPKEAECPALTPECDHHWCR